MSSCTGYGSAVCPLIQCGHSSTRKFTVKNGVDLFWTPITFDRIVTGDRIRACQMCYNFKSLTDRMLLLFYLKYTRYSGKTDFKTTFSETLQFSEIISVFDPIGFVFCL